MLPVVTLWRSGFGPCALPSIPPRKALSSPMPFPLIFGFFGTWDLAIIGFIAMLLFGNRLPTMMRSLGQGVQEFKKGVAGIEDDRDEQKPGDGNRKIGEGPQGA